MFHKLRKLFSYRYSPTRVISKPKFSKLDHRHTCSVFSIFIAIFQQHTDPVATEYMHRLYTMLPKTALLNQKKKRKKLTHLEELDTHSFAVQ